jgi:hypothetical protein
VAEIFSTRHGRVEFGPAAVGQPAIPADNPLSLFPPANYVKLNKYFAVFWNERMAMLES